MRKAVKIVKGQPSDVVNWVERRGHRTTTPLICSALPAPDHCPPPQPPKIPYFTPRRNSPRNSNPPRITRNYVRSWAPHSQLDRSDSAPATAGDGGIAAGAEEDRSRLRQRDVQHLAPVPAHARRGRRSPHRDALRPLRPLEAVRHDPHGGGGIHRPAHRGGGLRGRRRRRFFLRRRHRDPPDLLQGGEQAGAGVGQVTLPLYRPLHHADRQRRSVCRYCFRGCRFYS